MANLKNLRTWIEIDSRAARHNYDVFRKLVGRRVKLWSVVKSNAYGHGLMLFAKLMQKFGIDGFCVDSLVEGIRLRKEGIRKPILVLGPTLPSLYGEAARKNITISISNFDALRALASSVAEKATDKRKLEVGKSGRTGIPEFHLKIDTGMHRQGFYLEDVPGIISFMKSRKLEKKLTGVFTHFASAKDINYPTFTDKQFAEFEKAVALLENVGFKHLAKHASATGGTLIDKKHHLDAVRVGIGLYGLWPSKELEAQLGGRIKLKPILSWHAVVSEVKRLKPGDYVGYDLAERVPRETKMAILPVGYWHGFPRSLSHAGEAIVGGRRARVLGRVSMDLVTVDIGDAKCGTGAEAVLIGRDGAEEILAAEIAQKSGTIHYEFLTRLNPLIERILV